MVVKDVLKFVQIFAGVIDKSTPHLYLSGLAFSPSQSVMTTHLEKFSGIAKVAVGQQNDWPRNECVLQCGLLVSVALSPDGRHIVSGSYDKIVQVWDAQTGQQVATLSKGTQTQSTQLLFHQMEGTLCQAHMTRPFEFGMHRHILVSLLLMSKQ